MGGAERGHLGKEDRRVSNRIEQRRGGFSLVELLLVMSIIGILAGVAIPNMRNVTYRARAAAVDGDLNVLRQATLDYNADRNGWPAEVASGVVPPELSAFLPEGFSFTGEGYELDFENITLPFGLPGNPSVTRTRSSSTPASAGYAFRLRPSKRRREAVAVLAGATRGACDFPAGRVYQGACDTRSPPKASGSGCSPSSPWRIPIRRRGRSCSRTR
jgi:prepilin-type N-terminal cleavage/methylation domain-containing protein